MVLFERKKYNGACVCGISGTHTSDFEACGVVGWGCGLCARAHINWSAPLIKPYLSIRVFSLELRYAVLYSHSLSLIVILQLRSLSERAAQAAAIFVCGSSYPRFPSIHYSRLVSISNI